VRARFFEARVRVESRIGQEPVDEVVDEDRDLPGAA
jgi:hypothetical protein